MKTMTFHPTAHATGEAPRHVLVFVPNSSSNRNHVTRSTVLRIDRSQDVIKQRTLFKLRILHVWLQRKECARHLQHVVDIAGFVRATVDTFRQLVRWAKVLIFAMSTRRVAVIVYHDVPEILGGNAISGIASVNILFQHTKHFGHLRVAVLTGKFVLTSL